MAELLRLTLESQRGPERLADFTREISAELGRQPELDVREATTPSAPGERSAGAILIGQLVVKFVLGGAAKALIDSLLPYFERDRSLVIALKTSDGFELKIEGKDLRPEKVGEIIQALRPLERSAPAG